MFHSFNVLEWLFGGQPILGYLPADEFAQHYNYFINDQTTSHYIYIRVISGSILGIALQGAWDQYPNRTAATSKTAFSGSGTGEIRITMDPSQIKPGFLGISVYKSSPNSNPSSFEISVAQVSQPIYLTQDQPREFTITSANDYRSFVFTSGRNATRMSITLDSCNSLPAPSFYLSENSSNITPSKGEYDYKSQQTEIDGFQQVLTAHNIKLRHKYYIGVSSNVAQTFLAIYPTTASSKSNNCLIGVLFRVHY